MQEIFGIAAFRSRQQVLRLEAALRREGLMVNVINTPRDVALGCGLSVRFRIEDAPAVQRAVEREKPGNWLLTGMSDLSAWKEEWLAETLRKLRNNPQHEAIFLSKRPDLLNIDTDLENAWFGVTITRRSELWRLQALRENVRAKHYHVTFEPLFDDPGDVNLTGIDWIVVGTMTGAMKKRVHTEPEWAYSLIRQAHEKNIPVFMKEDLEPILGEGNMVQELPEAFGRVLEEQNTWNSRKSKSDM